MSSSLEKKAVLRQSLSRVQEEFPWTRQGLWDFAQLVINSLIPNNPDLNRVQADILEFMAFGSRYRMVQAQRGQAKTTLAGIVAAFLLIHYPYYRIVIFSQTDKRAKEIMGWVVKIFRRIDFLDFMLPNRSEGDRDSTEAFEISYLLKGDDKSPSVSCYSITAGAQGSRADFLIADDIESLQNSRTASAREWLEEQSKEFESINQEGDILYLGTPQSMDSIYNSLPRRGYEVRIWTGRYPTVKQAEDYGGLLAPMLEIDIQNNPALQTGFGLDGKAGAPTCPEMFGDEELKTKELSLGTSKFMLQQMLNTKVSDANRYPLKPSDLIVMHFGKDEGAVMPVWNNSPLNRIETRFRVGAADTSRFYNPIPREYNWQKFTRKIMYIDPAGSGANSDETAFAIVFQLGNMLYVYKWGAVQGGYNETDLLELVQHARDAGVHEVFIEENFGKGALMAVIKPLFQQEYPSCQLKDDYNLGQKEIRIIDTLEPLLNSHRIVVNQDVLKANGVTSDSYNKDALRYSGFYQLASLTRARGSLKNDDRIDALASACALFVADIDYSHLNKIQREQARESLDFTKMMLDPKRRREHFGAAAPSKVASNAFSAKPKASKRKWGKL